MLYSMGPDGLAREFIIGEDFIGDDEVCLVLGDNILFGQSFGKQLSKVINELGGATFFGYKDQKFRTI